jgi:aspartate aminotransferase-like enzyme
MEIGRVSAPRSATGAAFGRFFLPGPTEVRPKILEAMLRPMIGHRGADAVELMEALQAGLREVFGTARPVFVSSSSATGLMEAAVRNGASRSVLSLVNGAFSERFAEIAEACGREVDRLEVPWGSVHDPATVAEALRAGRYEAVTMVHSETSTGALNPIREIAEAVRAAGESLVLVDSVTGVGGAELHADAWGLDFVLTGSQKALALPPGLALGVASERMMACSAMMEGKGVYFDLVALEENLGRMQTPNTPALSLMYALESQLEDVHTETMERRWARHRAMAQRTWSWVDRMAGERGIPLRVMAPERGRSPTVTAVEMPGGQGAPAVVKALRERGWTVGGGYGALKERSFRIGHMGDHTVAELDGLLEALEEVLS